MKRAREAAFVDEFYIIFVFLWALQLAYSQHHHRRVVAFLSKWYSVHLLCSGLGVERRGDLMTTTTTVMIVQRGVSGHLAPSRKWDLTLNALS